MSDSVQRLRKLLDEAGGSALALTGAGMSTDSGIPDYRGPRGSYSRGHKPMTHDEFLSTEANRKRCPGREKGNAAMFVRGSGVGGCTRRVGPLACLGAVLCNVNPQTGFATVEVSY